MDVDSNRIHQLVERPSESLSVELKRWIDPDTPEGIAKVVRAALALRNSNGGYLIIGFDNETLEPDTEHVPRDVKSRFHVDKIQGLISRFASEPFEIAVELQERDGQPYPVIVVPPGVKTPVAAKSDLPGNDKPLISAGDIYIRSLCSNNTTSTTKATWKDWPRIVEICFDNREADIGRFLRRHLGGLTPEAVREFVSTVFAGVEAEVPTKDLLRYLQESEERYKTVVKEQNVPLPEHGAWEVGLQLIGHIPEHSVSQDFLNLLDSSNPDYTGWPVWLDSRRFRDAKARPYVFEGIWEAIIIRIDAELGSDHIDFMRVDPKGRFYLRRALQDDIARRLHTLKPMTVLDFSLPVVHTAEAIAVGIAFGKAMGCKSEETQLSFAFRWTRLHGRELTSWVQPWRDILPGRSAYQDEVVSFVNVPLETPLSALDSFVNQAVQPLFQVFDGFVLSKDVIEDLTRRLVERRL